MINSLPKSLIEAAEDALVDIRRIPFVDVSHHKTKKHNLSEGNLTDWVNHKRDWESQYPDVVMTNKYGLNGVAYEKKDPYHELAQEHALNLDQKHYNAVDAYITGGLENGDETGSGRVNAHLIHAHKWNKEPQKEFKFGEDEDFQKVLNLDHLDDALKQNKLEKQITTYSGLGFNPKHIMKDNQHLHLPAYTSSSSDRAVSLMYAKPDDDGIHHVLQIAHPKGSTGLYIGDNEDFSPFMQKEHIMPRGTTLKINPTPDEHIDNMGNVVHVWKARRLLK